MSIIVQLLVALLCLVIFFTGWAFVFFVLMKAMDWLEENFGERYKITWVDPIRWGMYLSGMLGYPLVVAAIVSILTGDTP